MKFIIDAIKANQDEDGKIDLEKLETVLKSEFPKNAVPKDQYNSVADNLKKANDTLSQLQSENKDAKELQDQIEKYKQEAADKTAELTKTRNESNLREALREAGANDVDYALYKIGELEADSDGNYKDIASAVENFKKDNEKWFVSEGEGDGEGSGGEDSKNKDDKNGGYKPIDNGLKNGKPGSGEGTATLKDAITEHYNKK